MSHLNHILHVHVYLQSLCCNSHPLSIFCSPLYSRNNDESGKSAEEKEATRQDRLRFSQLVAQLSSEQLGTLVQMIQKECHEAINDDDEEELEIEINTLDQNTLQQLIAYCTQCIDQKSGADKSGETPKPKKK